jgi:hypothetical protein
LRLVSRFAERFDNHEALETFECNESALNTVPSLVAAGYTPDAMEKFYRSLYDVCGESFRRANPLANLNFWVTPDRTAALLAHAVEVGCGLSATDINERSYAIQAFRGQVGGVDYRGRGITFLAEVSIATLDRYLATATPTLIMEWMRANGVTHGSWIHYSTTAGERWADIVRTIDAAPAL